MRRHNNPQRGSALVGVMMVTALLSVVAGILLLEVVNASRVANRDQSSELAFHAAEAGLEAGRLAFEKTNNIFGIAVTNGTMPNSSFQVRPGVGNFGTESWPQWGFDNRASRHNPTSQVGDQPRIGWRTQFTPAKNGNPLGGIMYVNNLYAVVANGIAFLSYENPSTNRIAVAGFSAMDGSVLWNTDASNLLGNGLAMSAMATIPEANILIFTYLSQNDPNGTVRLMALNVSNTAASIRWNYNTGWHGLGSSPVLYNPDPTVVGDEIIYFTVHSAPNWQVTDIAAGRLYPESTSHGPDNIFVYAIEDGGQNTPIEHWVRPFPDPDVVDWTDYPTERWTVASGVVDRPADVYTRPPDEDLLVDYYDSGTGVTTTFRGDLYMRFDPSSFSPPVLNVENNGTPADPNDDHIHIYVTYTAITNKDLPAGDSLDSGTTPPSAGNERVNWQAEMVALLDTPNSRFPTFQWTYTPPAHDVNRTDGIAWDAYTEENWETYFEQQAAPMVTMQSSDPNTAAALSPARPVIYMAYESTEFVNNGAYNNSSDAEKSRALVMGVVDRYDELIAGTSTVPYYEWWVNADGPNPYNWNEDDIITVGDLPNATKYPSITRSADIDVEGESLAYDATTNLLYFVFNHDLYDVSQDLEMLRIHAINARTGFGRGVVSGAITHLWDYENPAVLSGDVFNATPALAGNLVYMLYVSPAGGGRTAQLNILHSNDGTPVTNSPLTIDTDCDGADIAPSVANDAIYLGTYDDVDKIQRVYALSPSVWLLSTGTSNDGRARRTLALRQINSTLQEWREGGFATP